jgi:hypothetical protein
VSIAIRYDAGTLRAAKRTPQGFVQVDGYASRIGVQEYRNGPKVRRELRLPDDVFADPSLGGFLGLPITDDHPSEMVNSENAAALTKGTVLTTGRRDGDKVMVTATIYDKKLIRKMDGGKRQLSVGYLVELDETPGEHPVYGKYDAIQRNIVPNHLAVVERGRAGAEVAVRMDGANSDVWVEVLPSDARLTSVDDGHQHVIQDRSAQSGCTSYAMSEDAECGHDHAWTRGPDGTITIAMNAGHTHTLLDDPTQLAATDGAAQDLLTASAMPSSVSTDAAVHKDSPMTLEEALAENTQLKAKISEIEGKTRADAEAASEAKIKALETQVTELTASTETLKTEKAAADNARKDAETDKALAIKAREDAEATMPARVASRVKLESEVAKVLGSVDDKNQPIDRSAIAPRDLQVSVIKHVDGDDYSDKEKFDDSYVRAMYDGAIKRHAKGAQAVADTAAAVASNRADGAQVLTPNAGTTAEVKASETLRNNLSTAWMGK